MTSEMSFVPQNSGIPAKSGLQKEVRFEERICINEWIKSIYDDGERKLNSCG